MANCILGDPIEPAVSGENCQVLRQCQTCQHAALEPSTTFAVLARCSCVRSMHIVHLINTVVASVTLDKDGEHCINDHSRSLPHFGHINNIQIVDVGSDR